jgi:hypothetical protein
MHAVMIGMTSHLWAMEGYADDVLECCVREECQNIATTLGAASWIEGDT